MSLEDVEKLMEETAEAVAYQNVRIIVSPTLSIVWIVKYEYVHVDRKSTRC
jgi:hypothetical protein